MSYRLGLAFRVVLIVVLLAGVWFVWVRFPSQNDSRVAAQFCASIEPGTSAVEILQAASARGGATFAAPSPDVLEVGFGNSKCIFALSGGVVSGKASTSGG